MHSLPRTHKSALHHLPSCTSACSSMQHRLALSCKRTKFQELRVLHAYYSVHSAQPTERPYMTPASAPRVWHYWLTKNLGQCSSILVAAWDSAKYGSMPLESRCRLRRCRRDSATEPIGVIFLGLRGLGVAVVVGMSPLLLSRPSPLLLENVHKRAPYMTHRNISVRVLYASLSSKR